MVTINGNVAKRVLNPIIIIMEQKNSANVANTRLGTIPMPIGSANFSSSPLKNFKIFGSPWPLIIKKDTTILKKARKLSIVVFEKVNVFMSTLFIH